MYHLQALFLQKSKDIKTQLIFFKVMSIHLETQNIIAENVHYVLT